MKIERLTEDHWGAIRRIHAEGIATGMATFETEPASSWESWSRSHLDFGRFVALADDAVAGWVALTPMSNRCVYAGVAEVSVYIGAEFRGRGIASALMGALIDASEKNGIWTLEARMFPENEASVRLHGKFGFRRVGRRERLGKLAGVWRDVLLLERRSDRVGTD